MNATTRELKLLCILKVLKMLKGFTALPDTDKHPDKHLSEQEHW